MQSIWDYCGAFMVGGLGWWVAEYLIHRFVGHGKSTTLPFSRHHKKHHAQAHYFAPIRDKVKVAGFVIVSLFSLGLIIAAWQVSLAFATGFTSSYLSYEFLHRRAHSHPPITRYGRWLRKHHFHHHFMNPKSNHGVITALGDILFTTAEKPQRVKVPEKLAMPWLIDPQTGDVHQEFSGDYELVYLKRRRRSPNNQATGQALEHNVRGVIA
ncbi:MAG: sterol desaturase family protein [Myxococcota bacterium]|nr:sterol desaturase family protein [Myxococcota bacterium]